MKTYKVELTLVLADDAQHPRKWVADAINENIEFDKGEDIADIEIKQVDNESE